MAQRIISDPGIALGTAQLASLLDSTREIIAVLSADGTVQFVRPKRIEMVEQEEIMKR